MKKALVLALVAISFAGTAAQAAPGKPARGLRAVEAARNKEVDRRNTRNAAPQATVSAEGVRLQNTISSSGLSGVTSQSSAALIKAANDPIVKRGFDTIIANKNADANMVTLQLNALSLLPNAKGTPASKEIAADLIIGAGSKSVKWADKKAKDNVEFMIRETMEGLAQGKTVDQALANAKEQLHKQKGVDLDLAKIKDLCK